MMRPRITAALLLTRKACPEQVQVFACEWPKGAAITVENVSRARALDLDVEWLRCLLPNAERRAYEEAIATALRAYEERPALRAYAEAIAMSAYREAVATALVAALIASHPWERER